jgi:hypothetical protein
MQLNHKACSSISVPSFYHITFVFQFETSDDPFEDCDQSC